VPREYGASETGHRRMERTRAGAVVTGKPRLAAFDAKPLAAPLFLSGARG
jgi:hypothetical protein